MRKRKGDKGEMEPQKSSAAQFITHIASTWRSSEKSVIQNYWITAEGAFLA